MDWFVRERRGPQRKQGWRGQALASMSLPPPPLLAVFAIVALFLSLSRYGNYREKVHRTEMTLRLLFLLVMVLLGLVAWFVFAERRFVFRVPVVEQQPDKRSGSSPWGVAALLVVVLFMVSHQSSFHSRWFRPLWRSH